jgi:hypothetical protein
MVMMTRHLYTTQGGIAWPFLRDAPDTGWTRAPETNGTLLDLRLPWA